MSGDETCDTCGGGFFDIPAELSAQLQAELARRVNATTWSPDTAAEVGEARAR